MHAFIEGRTSSRTGRGITARHAGEHRDRPPLRGDLSGADEEALIRREARPINAD